MIAQLSLALGIVLMSDSMSTTGNLISPSDCSWAQQINQGGHVHIQIDAQPGRAWQDFIPSPDRVPYLDVQTAIFWLGGNDARKYPDEPLLPYAQAMVDDWNARGWRVVVALPPLLNIPNWDTTAVRAELEQLEGADIVDPPQVETFDGIHPTCAGHTELGTWWFWTLYFLGV